jgi:glycolate oxidase FAD binding subunit
LVATGEAGALGMAYGTPRDHVLGLTVVTGDGRVLRLGGRVMKNVAGFDLVKLMVGSRGTLGVVVSACMRLFPRPAEERVLVLSAQGPGALLEAARRVLTASVVPASALLLAPAPDSSGGGALVVRVQGARTAVDADARKLLGPALPQARMLDGAAARQVLAAARDHATGHRVVVRAYALPGLLPEVLSAVQESLPVAAVAADVMSGRVRVGLEPSDSDPTPLLLLRNRLDSLGGSLVFERMEPWQAYPLPTYGSRGRPGTLDRSLRARFDPAGVLSPGRFES